MKRKLVIIASSLIVLILITSLIIGSRTLDQYNQLELGLNKSQVRTIFDAPPCYTCYYKNYEIWYYKGSSPFVSEFPHDEYNDNQLFNRVDNLPDAYGYVTIAFDHLDQLHAYTWIGETYSVDYVGGSAKGSHFSFIPSDFF